MAHPAFRSGDPTLCPADGAGSASEEPSSVHVNGRPLRRVGDKIICGRGIDRLSSGASQVLLGGRPVGRVASRTQHGAGVMAGSTNVLVGSPTACGCEASMTDTCQAMAAGRHPPPGTKDKWGNPIPPHRSNQSYNNCGVESMRQILHQAGKDYSEDELLDWMESHYLSGPVRAKRHLGGDDLAQGRYWWGGTLADEWAGGLTDLGVPASNEPTTAEGIQQAVGEGKGVIVSVHAGDIWDNTTLKPGEGNHAILVTAVEYDAQGRVTAYIINDTGMGQCGRRIAKDRLERAFTGGPMSVTDHPIW